MRNAWVVLLLLACGTPSPHDGGATDSGANDAGVVVDAGHPGADAGASDAGASDAGTPDAGPADAGPADAGPADAGPADAGRADSGVTDAGGPVDAGGIDAGAPDAGADAGSNGGDPCAMAPNVTAGGVFSGTTVGAQNQYGSGLNANLGCPAGGSASGPEVAYLLTPAVTTQYRVTVTPTGSSFDPLLYVQGACGAAACLAGTAFNSAGQPESITFSVTGGTAAHIIVDGELGTSGAFSMEVQVLSSAMPDAGLPDAGAPDAGSADAGPPTLNGGDLCEMAPDVTAGGTFRGTTVGALDQYGFGLTTNCPAGGAASGNDVTYLLNPLISTTYTVTVTPFNAQFDPLLYVQATCGTGACITGTTLNGAGQPESVTFTVPGGTSAYIIVDGELGTSGSFEISIVRH